MCGYSNRLTRQWVNLSFLYFITLLQVNHTKGKPLPVVNVKLHCAELIFGNKAEQVILNKFA